MALSQETLVFFEVLLNTVRLDASAPDFEEVALQVIQARKELTEELAQFDLPESLNP